MANGARGFRDDQQAVAVAIGRDVLHEQKMPGTLAFGPQASLAAAKERHPSTRLRCGERLGIHVAEHEHGAAARVLHDRRNQPVHLCPVKIERHKRTSMPLACSSRFKAGIEISAEWNTLAASAASTRAAVN